VRFMTRAQVQSITQTDNNPATRPRQPEVYDLPSIPDPPEQAKAGQHRSGVISRPSNVTGRAYEQVTAAYIAAVHSVLTGEKGRAGSGGSARKAVG
jgi:trehalose/maltose transport system substrate-binding protein